MGSPQEEFEKSLRGLSPGTAEIYRAYLNEFLAWNKATPQSFYEWVRSLETSADSRSRKQLSVAFADFAKEKIASGIAATTMLNYKKAVHKFLSSNEIEVRIKSNGNKPRYRGQDIVTLEQIKKLVDLAKSNLRLRAILMVLKDSGLGVSEVAMLTVEEFLGAREIKDDAGRRFRQWKNPILRAKTGEICEVCLGPESIGAVEDYLGSRRSGALFLTSKGQPHDDEEGNVISPTRDRRGKVTNEEYTPRGAPMTAESITSTIAHVCRVLKNKGSKVSAHSFRKLFETSFELEGKLNTAKIVMGKAVSASDEAYLKLGSNLLFSYAEVYTKRLLLNDEARKLEVLTSDMENMQQSIDTLHKMQIESARSAAFWMQTALSKMTESERNDYLRGATQAQIADIKAQLENETDPIQRRILTNLIKSLKSGDVSGFLVEPSKIGKVVKE